MTLKIEKKSKSENKEKTSKSDATKTDNLGTSKQKLIHSQFLKHKCYRFDEKVVIITGGGGAIGYAAAQRLASEGAIIVLTDIMKSPKLKSLAAKLQSEMGLKSLAIRADVTKLQDIKNVIKETLDTFGRIDCLFNNAGYQGAIQPLDRYPEDDFSKVMKINVEGNFNFMK